MLSIYCQSVSCMTSRCCRYYSLYPEGWHGKCGESGKILRNIVNGLPGSVFVPFTFLITCKGMNKFGIVKLFSGIF